MADEDRGGERRRRRRKDARPAEIVEAGLKAFGEKGFAATRLDDVADRAGVAKGTIYLYFDNKEALFIAAVRSRLLPVFEQAGRMIDVYDGPTAALMTHLLRTLYDRLVNSDLRLLMRIIVAEGHKFPEIAELYHREAISEGRALLTRVIARGIARGDVRPGPAADMPIVVIGPALMAAIWKLVFDPVEPLDTERFLAAHIDLVVNGLCIQRPAGS